MKYKLEIAGMSCDHCKSFVTKALSEEGLKVLEADLKGAVIEAGSAVDESRLKEIIDDAGYELLSIAQI